MQNIQIRQNNYYIENIRNYDEISHISFAITFQAVNKLHIEMKPCPTLLAAKLIGTFPKFSLTRDELRVIKLSYKNYTDQDRGRLDVSFNVRFHRHMFNIKNVFLFIVIYSVCWLEKKFVI